MLRRVLSAVRRSRIAPVASCVALAAALGAGCGASTADRGAARETTRAAGTADTAAAGGGAAGGAAAAGADTLWLLAAAAAGDAVHAADSEATLVLRYGRANVRRDSLPGAEGESVYGTVLFPTDSVRTLYVYWRDDTFRGVESVRTAPGATAWVAWPGIAPGDAMTEVERRNGRPFDLSGFGWDYGGLVVDWRGGRFASLTADTLGFTAVRFRAGRSAKAPQGEDTFSSASAGMRAADARVSDLTVQAR
jgi:acyl-coenzyme A thioesterase PaaI-like protein